MADDFLLENENSACSGGGGRRRRCGFEQNKCYGGTGRGGRRINAGRKKTCIKKVPYNRRINERILNILKDYGISSSIKWPNDVLVNDAKIAGILCETVMKKNVFQGLVLGLGVNLNVQKEDLAKITDKIATSLNIELGCEYVDKQVFTEKLLSAFFENYDEFLKKGFAYLKGEYKKSCTFLGNEVCVKGFRDEIKGFAKDISDTGALVLEHNGKDVIITMGDIL